MELLPQIKEMLATGMTQKQVEKALGLIGYRPVHELLKRERRKDVQGSEDESRPRRCRNTSMRISG